MVKLDNHYVDPRLVAMYDIENQRGADTDFYLNLARELDAQSIVDLGCGTGLLTLELATAERNVTGVDPSSAMLAVARQKSDADSVTWIEGDASALGTLDADLLIMTGNVAQIFLDDANWQTTLEAIHEALREGGYLAFESRNPDYRSWEKWTPEATYAKYDTPYGEVETWLEVLDIRNGQVKFQAHNVFTATGEDVISESELRFRSHDELHKSLTDAGFTVEDVYGYWDKRPVNSTNPAMIFIARGN